MHAQSNTSKIVSSNVTSNGASRAPQSTQRPAHASVFRAAHTDPERGHAELSGSGIAGAYAQGDDDAPPDDGLDAGSHHGLRGGVAAWPRWTESLTPWKALALCAVLLLIGVVVRGALVSGQGSSAPGMDAPDQRPALKHDGRVSGTSGASSTGTRNGSGKGFGAHADGGQVRLEPFMQVESVGTPAPRSAAEPATTTPPGGQAPARSGWLNSRQQNDSLERRGLEAELALHIAHMEGVRGAKVFLDLPQATGIGGRASSPTASVWVETETQDVLTPLKVEAIAALVSGAKSGFEPSMVRVIDQRGNVRTGGQISAAALARWQDADRARRELEHTLTGLLASVPGARVAVSIPLLTPGVTEGGAQSGAQSAAISVAVPLGFAMQFVPDGEPAVIGAAESFFEETIRPALVALIEPHMATAASLGAATSGVRMSSPRIAVVLVPGGVDLAPGAGPAGVRRADRAGPASGQRAPGRWLGQTDLSALWTLAGAGALVAMVFAGGFVAIRKHRKALRSRAGLDGFAAFHIDDIGQRAEHGEEGAGEHEGDEAGADPRLLGAAWQRIVDAPMHELVGVLRESEPFVVAAVLHRLTPARAAVLLARIPSALRAEAMRELVAQDESADALPALPAGQGELAQDLADRLQASRERSRRSAQNAAKIASILDASEVAAGRTLMAELRAQDPELASDIQRRTTTLEDALRGLDAPGIVRVIEQAGMEELAAALWSSSQSTREHVLGNAPEHHAGHLRAMVSGTRGVRVAELDASRAAVLEAALPVRGALEHEPREPDHAVGERPRGVRAPTSAQGTPAVARSRRAAQGIST